MMMITRLASLLLLGMPLLLLPLLLLSVKLVPLLALVPLVLPGGSATAAPASSKEPV
jgi:hypothetical protein